MKTSKKIRIASLTPETLHWREMKNEIDPLDVNNRFFAALTSRCVDALREILADDFLLIDVLTGAEVVRTDLIAVIESGQLVFERIESFEPTIRHFGEVAVITGRTEMDGKYVGTPFSVRSRYTHVFFKKQGAWLLVAAQGTPIAVPR